MKNYPCFGEPLTIDPAKCAVCPKAGPCHVRADLEVKVQRWRERKNRERMAQILSRRGYPIRACRAHFEILD